MSQRRFEITCPHCRRSYSLRVDPDNLGDAAAKVRCGRCRKRFRLSAAVAASEEKAEVAPPRNTYRKRISRPAMRRVEIDDNPNKIVDDMALAFERALQERRKNREDGLTATEAELPLEEDESLFDAAPGNGEERQKRRSPAVFHFTPPPIAREIIFGASAGAAEDAATKEAPVLDEEPEEDEAVAAEEEPAPPEAEYGHKRPRSRSSRPPRPLEKLSSIPPPPAVEPDPADNIASRQAWLDFAEEPLDGLIPARTESVTALEWLLGEDALRDM